MNGHRRSFIHFFYGGTFSFGTPLFKGHVHLSGDTKFGPGLQNVLFVTSIYFPIQRKGTLFLSPETWV